MGLREPVPFFIVSNGRDHYFYKRITEIDPNGQKIHYVRVTETHWADITTESPRKVRILLTADQLRRNSQTLTGITLFPLLN